MRRSRADTLALGVYALLAAATTFPLVLHFATAVPGAGGDAWLFYWNIWWTKTAVLERFVSPLHTTMVRFPYGADLRFHTLNLLQDVLTLPVAAFSITAAYNTIVFAGFVLGGFCAFRLCADELGPGGREAGRDEQRAALIGGAVFAFSTYQFTHVRGHLDMMSSWWLPLAALSLLRTLQGPRWRPAFACGVCYGAVALTSEYYLLALVLFTLVAVVHGMLTRTNTAGWVWRLIAAAASGIAIASPILVALLQHPDAAAVSDSARDVNRFSVDLVAFVTPSRLHPLWSHVVDPVYRAIEHGDSGNESIAYLGIVPIVLSVFAARRRWPGRALWFAGAALFALLAMGPIAHVGGHALPGWPERVMPYRWLVAIPLRDIPRVPSRFMALTMLCVSVVTSQGALVVLRSVPRNRATLLTVAVVIVCCVDNALVPTPLASTIAAAVPAAYRTIAADADAAAVLEAPIPDDPSLYPERMLFQTIHRHPVYGGYLSRGTGALQFDAIPGFSLFRTLSPSIDDLARYDESAVSDAGRRLLRAYSAGYVVVDKRGMSPEAVARLRVAADRMLGAAQVFADDEQTLAYRVVDPVGPVARPVLWLDTGWSYLERDPNGSPDRWRWLADTARLGVVGPPGRLVRIAFEAHAFARARRVRLTGREGPLATCTIATSPTRCETEPFAVDERPAYVALDSLDGAEPPGTADPRRLSIAVSSMRLVEPQQVR